MRAQAVVGGGQETSRAVKAGRGTSLIQDAGGCCPNLGA
jgi:hypothetical protein